MDGQTEMVRHALDIRPSHLRIGTELLPLHKRNLAVAEVKKVPQCYLGGPLVVKHDVSYALHVVVS